jgi:hypothetical protein
LISSLLSIHFLKILPQSNTLYQHQPCLST